MKKLLISFTILSFLNLSIFASPEQYLCSDLNGGRYQLTIESIFMPFPIPNPMPEPFPMPNSSGDRSVGSLDVDREEDNKMIIIHDLISGRRTSDSLSNFRTADVELGESKIKLFYHLITKRTYSCTRKLDRDGPRPQFEVQFGQVVPAMGIGGETTGIGLVDEMGKMIEITGANNEITQQLYGLYKESIKVRGYWGKNFGVERKDYDVFFVVNIYR
ncbi:hypothetical protein N9N67_10190 [Bacteriovoracaceae bacterium]|nr:hypothetical protein [Bacteriovoracaceae bacterium]